MKVEDLLDWLNIRTLVVVGACVGLFFAANRYGGYPRQWYDRWRNPPTGPAVGGQDIQAALDREKSVRLRALYQNVTGEIAQAQAEGLDVTGLQADADATLAFDTPRYRSAAIDNLNKIRMAIPQPVERARPAGTDETDDDDQLAAPRATSIRSRPR